jgi:hypothetical protein
MALAEFPDPAHPAHRHAVAMKSWVRSRLGELAGELAGSVPIAHPAAVADHLVLIMEGVYGSAQALGAEGPARRARALAEMLLPET